MNNFAAIVIGAGPAGLSCARLLAEGGIKVLVLERKNIIGPKVCGGGITWKGLIQRVPEELIERSFAVQHIRSNYQNIRITSTYPIIATVSRKKLGQWMYRQAVAAGACVMTGMTVRKINQHRVTAVDDIGTEHNFNYRYLVGADGSNSRVRKYLRLESGGMGVGIHYRIPGAFDSMEWHLTTELFGNGYSWIFPFQNHASIGIYTDGSVLQPKEMLNRLHNWASGYGIDLNGHKPRAGLINYDYQGWRFGNKMLIGDAAGLASSLTGEGIYPAIVSGEAAARAIIDPCDQAEDLKRLICKQQNHRQILKISGKNATACTMIMEMLTLGLRIGAIPINKLEMAD